jgi:hypothetical protein
MFNGATGPVNISLQSRGSHDDGPATNVSLPNPQCSTRWQGEVVREKDKDIPSTGMATFLVATVGYRDIPAAFTSVQINRRFYVYRRPVASHQYPFLHWPTTG